MSDFIHSKQVQIIIKTASVICMLIASLIAFVYFRADLRTLAVYFVFLIFYVLVPGTLIMDNLGLRSDIRATQLSRSFFTGFAFNILLYYLSVIMGTDILLYAAGPLLSVIWITQTARNGIASFLQDCRRSLANAPSSLYLFAALTFVFSMLATQYTYISPANSAFSFMKIDFAYHAGIVNALALGYPPADPWVNGLGIEYHFFTEMLLSIPVRLFGLPSEELILSGTPYLITPLLTVSFYSFFKEFSGMPERAGLYCLSLHLSNLFILKQFADSWFLYQLYSNINNVGVAIACLLTILPLLKIWDRDSDSRKDRFNTREMLLLALFVMLLTGIKGPIAAALVAGTVGTLALGLILRKVDARAFALVVLSGISFVLIYMYVLGAQHSNTKGGSVLNMGEITDIFFAKEDIMALGLPKYGSWLLLFAVFAVFFFTAFFLPFIAGYVRELFLVLTGRKEFVFSRVTVYALCTVGFLGLMLLNFNGHSQVYFGFTACALIPMVSFWFFEDLRENRSVGVRLVRGVFALNIFFFACTYGLYIANALASTGDFYESHNIDTHVYKGVSAAEYEGLLWLRDNTPKDSLIASDRYYSIPLRKYELTERASNTHFAYAVYSRRNQYIEGSGFSIGPGGFGRRRNMLENNEAMHDPGNEDRGSIARELGVDYVVVSKRFSSTADLSNDDYRLCYQNPEMDIYEVKQ
ncbi:MAG: hypothetical protein IKE74_04780 [Mogibacterium sp.]|nr:hypothetical protein [Mogibacterium sp.]